MNADFTFANNEAEQANKRRAEGLQAAGRTLKKSEVEFATFLLTTQIRQRKR